MMAYLLQHLLTESAARLPDKEAVRFQDLGLTYAQLDSLTNQIAQVLKAAGVQRGERIGIYVHKSLASVAGVFGIMKAGGVYVPLDPNSPPSRLAYITRNCNIKVLLTSSEKIGTLPEFFVEGTPIETVILTDNQNRGPVTLPEQIRLVAWNEVQAHPDEAVPARESIETDLAYILYTSGSTGAPKGVMISHRTIFTFVNWCYETFRMTEDDRVTSHAPLHFDLSTFDIYVTIKAGGTVVLIPERLSVFPERLAEPITK